MSDSDLWVHSDGVGWQQPLVKVSATLPRNLISGVVHTQSSPVCARLCPLRGSHCDIAGDRRLKFICVCLLPQTGLFLVPDTQEWWGPVDKRERQQFTLCLVRSAVFLTPSQGSMVAPGTFVLLTNLQGSMAAFFIVTFSLVKESDQPRELRGETKGRPREWGCLTKLEWGHLI